VDEKNRKTLEKQLAREREIEERESSIMAEKANNAPSGGANEWRTAGDSNRPSTRERPATTQATAASSIWVPKHKRTGDGEAALPPPTRRLDDRAGDPGPPRTRPPMDDRKKDDGGSEWRTSGDKERGPGGGSTAYVPKFKRQGEGGEAGAPRRDENRDRDRGGGGRDGDNMGGGPRRDDRDRGRDMDGGPRRDDRGGPPRKDRGFGAGEDARAKDRGFAAGDDNNWRK